MYMQPDANTLDQMLGDSTPIGDYEYEDYQEKLKSCTTITDFAKAICEYAAVLHGEQKSYEYISPYGGLDITVESVDEIALNEADKYSIFKGDTLNDAVLHELIRCGYQPESLLSFISCYEARQKLQLTLPGEWEAYKAKCNQLHQKISAYVNCIRTEGEREYHSEQQARVDFIKKNPLYRALHKGELRNITERMENAALKANTTENSEEVKEAFEEKWFIVDSDIPFDSSEEIYLDTEEKVENQIAAAKEFCDNPTNRESYMRAKSLLESRGKQPKIQPSAFTVDKESLDSEHRCSMESQTHTLQGLMKNASQRLAGTQSVSQKNGRVGEAERD